MFVLILLIFVDFRKLYWNFIGCCFFIYFFNFQGSFLVFFYFLFRIILVLQLLLLNKYICFIFLFVKKKKSYLFVYCFRIKGDLYFVVVRRRLVFFGRLNFFLFIVIFFIVFCFGIVRGSAVFMFFKRLNWVLMYNVLFGYLIVFFILFCYIDVLFFGLFLS